MRGLRFYLIVDDFKMEDAPEMPGELHRSLASPGSGPRQLAAGAIPILEKLPVDIVIDHIGRTPRKTGQRSRLPGASALHGTGRCWIKISAPYLASTMDRRNMPMWRKGRP